MSKDFIFSEYAPIDYITEVILSLTLFVLTEVSGFIPRFIHIMFSLLLNCTFCLSPAYFVVNSELDCMRKQGSDHQYSFFELKFE